MQYLRHRLEWQSLVKHIFQFDVAARDRIADHHQVGRRIKVLCAEGMYHRNAQRGQKVRHWGICRSVGACDAKAPLLQHSCQRSHRRATDTDQM